MDRQLIYTGQLPLVTDLLNSNLYAMVGLGRLALDILGSSTAAAGLACAPTSPASMSVNIGPGALYSLQNVDNTAYSAIPANTADQILKQGIVSASDARSLTMAAPTTAGYSVIYVIQAAYQDVDANSAILNYYNATNPAVPYTGPDNNSSSQPTVRQGRVGLQAKAGIAAASPVAPSVDPGYVALYYVTISYGQTSITSGNIAVAPGAPFLSAHLSDCLTATAAAATYAPLSAFSSTLAASGVQHLPGGLILQWKTITLATGSNVSNNAVTWPIAFPNGLLSKPWGNAAGVATSGWNPIILMMTSPTTTGCAVIADTGNVSYSLTNTVQATIYALGN